MMGQTASLVTRFRTSSLAVLPISFAGMIYIVFRFRVVRNGCLFECTSTFSARLDSRAYASLTAATHAWRRGHVKIHRWRFTLKGTLHLVLVVHKLDRPFLSRKAHQDFEFRFEACHREFCFILCYVNGNQELSCCFVLPLTLVRLYVRSF